MLKYTSGLGRSFLGVMLIRSRIRRQTKGVFAITDGVSTSVFSFGGSAGARPFQGGEEVWQMVNVGLYTYIYTIDSIWEDIHFLFGL